MASIIDMRGKRCGRLVVVKLDAKRKGEYHWLCKCDCGETCLVRGQLLRSGATKSCGCYNREVQTKRQLKHGRSKTREYSIWSGMKARCFNRNHIGYKHYGGRGITVCDAWRDSFEEFYKDMGPRPSKKHHIHRIDNNGDYSPENCEWTTVRQNQRQRGNNALFTHEGKTLCVAEWAEEKGVCEKLLRNRIRNGWSFERAITTPKPPKAQDLMKPL